MVPPLIASTSIGLIEVKIHLCLLVRLELRKLWVLPKSIKMNIGHLSIFPHILEEKETIETMNVEVCTL